MNANEAIIDKGIVQSSHVIRCLLLFSCHNCSIMDHSAKLNIGFHISFIHFITSLTRTEFKLVLRYSRSVDQQQEFSCSVHDTVQSTDNSNNDDIRGTK